MQNLNLRKVIRPFLGPMIHLKCITLRSYSFSKPKLTYLPKLGYHTLIKNLSTISPFSLLTIGEIYVKRILLPSAFFLVTPSKSAYKPSVLFRLSETKVVSGCLEINL